jgi:Na+/proline symporter
VTPPQVFLAAIVACVYAGMMFVGLSTVVASSGIAFFVMSPVIVVLSSLAAWHNVRLWYLEGADYEQVLKEEEGQSHKLHIPPVR